MPLADDLLAGSDSTNDATHDGKAAGDLNVDTDTAAFRYATDLGAMFSAEMAGKPKRIFRCLLALLRGDGTA